MNNLHNFKWFGEIPKSWNARKGKYLYKFIQTGRRDSGENDPKGKYPFFTCSKEVLFIDDYSFDMEAILVAGNGNVGETKYYKGKFDAYQRVYVISDFTSEIFLPYLTLYMTNNFMIYLNWRMIGSVINFVKLEDIKNFDITFPKYSVQVKIVATLSDRIRKIDTLIENQQQQIEKLKEYKQSLISEVVTKGLDPNVEFKDSGIEIIDKIPKDWGIIKMKYLGESRNGLTYNPSDMVDDGEGILVLRSSNVRDGKLIFDDNVYLKMQIKEDLMLKNGDILICSRNGSRDLIGKNAIIENVGLCSFGAFMMVFRVSKTNPKYIKYILDSFIFNYYLGTYLTATINQLTLSNFKNMKVIYTTNSDEQEKIISYLDEKCQKIDQLIELKAKKLLNLEEFKKSLIYEYVTGKKEVS